MDVDNEMSAHVVKDKLCCSRRRAHDLLSRHEHDACFVCLRETNFNELVLRHDDNADLVFAQTPRHMKIEIANIVAFK